MRLRAFLLTLPLSCALVSCSGNKLSFSLPTEEQMFLQSSQEIVQRKIDILWVVDNSGSMAPFQQSLTDNFQAFIQDFVQKDYDFQIAVTTSDAYLAGPGFRNNPSLSLFRDGGVQPGKGHPIIDNRTPDLLGTFTANATQGTQGSGDERVFSSLREALSNPVNQQRFPRKDSFLAVILLSDEDDFSSSKRPERTGNSPASNVDHNYNDPELEPIDLTLQFLDQMTNSKKQEIRNYTVSAVTILEPACATPNTSQIVGNRMIDLVKKSGGVLGSICSSNYAEVLKNIQKRIIELSTDFPLNRRAFPSSIRVVINDQILPQDSQNGWTYNPENNSIQFHGNGVPPRGATVSISYDPAEPRKPQSGDE